MPSIQTLLRKLGWKQSKGKWSNSEGHNRPLSLEQAKNAAARDLGSKNYDTLKKQGKLAKVRKAVSEGYQFTKGKFKKGRGKAKSLDDVSKAVDKQRKKIERKKPLDQRYKDEAEKRKLTNFWRTKKASHWREQFEDNELDKEKLAEYQRQLHNLFYGTGTQKQEALSYILIANGYRTGSEPWPAGQTPRRK